MRLVALPLFVAACGAAVPAAGRSVVVQTIGPIAATVPVGSVLADGRVVMLGGQDRLTLLNDAGTRTVQGPLRFVEGTASPRAAAALARLRAQREETRPKVAALRRSSPLPPPPRPVSLWDWDVRVTGNFCVLEGKRPALWRGDPAAADVLTIGGTRVPWPSGAAELPWPESVALTDGSVVQMAREGAGPAMVRLRLVLAADFVSLAEKFRDAGCTAQFDLLVGS